MILINLFLKKEGGIWSGNVITSNGTFYPLDTELGNHVISYFSNELCGDTTTIIVNVCGESYLENVSANVFSPNQDGKNETFYFDFEYLEEFSVNIYNRWGNKIYNIDKNYPV